MWTVVYLYDEAPCGWYVVDLSRAIHGNPSVLAGPYDKHEDAIQAADTRAYRLAQGWKP